MSWCLLFHVLISDPSCGFGGIMDIESANDEGDIVCSSIPANGDFHVRRSFAVPDISTDEEMIPLHSLGVVDVAATDVNENEMLAHALTNITRAEKNNGWAIKRSSDFVNEYPRKNEEGVLSDGSVDNPNHLLGSFPCLFPYGKGGFEVDRPHLVSYEAHT